MINSSSVEKSDNIFYGDCKGYYDYDNKKFVENNDVKFFKCCNNNCLSYFNYCIDNCNNKEECKKCENYYESCNDVCKSTDFWYNNSMYNCIKDNECFINFEISKECLIKNRDKKISCCLRNCQGDDDFCLEKCEYMFEYFTDKKYDLKEVLSTMVLEDKVEDKVEDYSLGYILIFCLIFLIMLLIFNVKNEK